MANFMMMFYGMSIVVLFIVKVVAVWDALLLGKSGVFSKGWVQISLNGG